MAGWGRKTEKHNKWNERKTKPRAFLRFSLFSSAVVSKKTNFEFAFARAVFLFKIILGFGGGILYTFAFAFTQTA